MLTRLRPYGAALGAVPLSVAIAAGFETARVPASVFTAAPARLPAVFAWAVVYALACGAAPLLGQIAVAWLLSRAEGGRLGRWARRLFAAGIAALVTACAYAVLARDSALAGYLPLLALHLEAFVVLALSWAWLADAVAEASAPPARRPLAVMVVCGGGFATATWANYAYYVDAYPALHLAVWQLALALLQVAVTALLLARRASTRAERVAVVALGGALALAAWVTASGAVDASRRYLWGHTVLGRSRILWAAASPPLVAAAPPTTATGVARFVAHAGMPTLPDALSLLDYNVLLIASESMRFDQTSLADARSGVTPSIARWRSEQHAFSFRRAYAASSTTLQSLASLFTMTFPSAAHWRGWERAWHGELLPDNRTVAEQFSSAGYATFWIGHNYLDLFDRGVLGFEQGFDTRQLFSCGHDTPSTDAQIADAAVARLREASGTQTPRKFFGWLFFVSPHLHYVAHGGGVGSRSPRELYRQELAYTDAQIGRVLQALEDTGLGQRTIVVILGDHGEELDDHGALGHSRTLYTESVHVPFVVRIPGVAGGDVEAPVSTSHLFPWLFLHGNSGMRDAVRARLNGEVGAMREATDGAVVLELLGRERMRSALVYRDHQVHYDFVSDLHELYDLADDPGEQRDLFERRPDLARVFAARIARYREVRDRASRFVIDARDSVRPVAR